MTADYDYDDDNFDKTLYTWPVHGIDYRRWGRKPYWTPEQAAALAIGRGFGSSEAKKHLVEDDDWRRLVDQFEPDRHFDRLVEAVREAQRTQELPQVILPVVFLDWARKRGIRFPRLLEVAVGEAQAGIAELEDRLEALRAKIQELTRERNDLRYQVERERSRNQDTQVQAPKPLTTRETDTLLKMVIGMAIDAYRYDPKAGKSTVPREIADALTELGIEVSDDTVRKWLKRAADEHIEGR